MNYLELIGRQARLFDDDISLHNDELKEIVSNSSFLIIGGAGSIGRAVVKEIFQRKPRILHVVDLSENNLVELVRDIRSSIGYIKGEFKTFAIDCGGKEFEVLINNSKNYDYVLNLSALKHVRSEKDPFTLMRMINVNIFNTIETINLAIENGVKKYFCVSTDKAANPVNLMGASKRIMEKFIMHENFNLKLSTARFANVAFSDGSLLQGFLNRFNQGQPIAAPNDVKRYFVTPQESGELCLMSCIFGDDKEIFFPKSDDSLYLTNFKDIAENFLKSKGYGIYECNSEEEARSNLDKIILSKEWPCYFSKSTTSGEKSFEEFYTKDEHLDLDRFNSIGVILKPSENSIDFSYDDFYDAISNLKNNNYWTKEDILNIFQKILSNFDHIETGYDLDEKM